MTQKFEYTILDMIESGVRNLKTQPLNLGGVAGAGGGAGAPPGGFIGWLPQTRVAYDQDEIASSGIPASGASLLDNLNHIRYRLSNLESDALIVDDYDNVPTVSGVNRITFSGAAVDDLGGGHVRITISGGGSPLIVDEPDGTPSVPNVNRITISGGAVVDNGGGHVTIVMSGGGGGGIPEAPIDSNIYGRLNAAWSDLDNTYLRLDATNDPLTSTLRINIIDNSEGLIVHQDKHTGSVLSPLLNLFRDSDLNGSFLAYPVQILDGFVSGGVGTYGGGTLVHSNFNFGLLVDVNPYAATTGTLALFNSFNAITASGRLLSLKNQSTEKFSVDGNGKVNIPTGQTYNINGTPHTHTGTGGFVICGRPTPTSGKPVEHDAVTGATALYWTPYHGNVLQLYNGSSFVATEFTELTLTLSNPNHAANVVFDTFAFDDSGTLRIGTFPWSSATSRGTGAGTAELENVKGVLLNKVQIVARNGATTYTIAANRATYLFSFRTNGSAGQVDWSDSKRLIWSNYNRHKFRIQKTEDTNSWDVTSTSWETLNGSTANRVESLLGWLEDDLFLEVSATVKPPTNGFAIIAIAEDSTTTPMTDHIGYNMQVNVASAFLPTWKKYAIESFGYHYYQAMQITSAATATFYGKNSGDAATRNAGIIGEWWG